MRRGGQRLLGQPGRGWFSRCGRQAGGGLPQPADFGGALRAPGQVTFEPRLICAGQRVQRVRARQGGWFGSAGFHRVTPRQSRNRISPSRIRVLTVPAAIPSKAATWR